MAHMVENMFYVGEMPWHKLGRKLDNPPTIKEGVIYAGLDWQADLKDLYLQDGRMVDSKAVVRSTDGSVLGVVGDRYRVLQNVEAFEWFQPFIETGLVHLESAGSLAGGKKVWVLAKIDGSLPIIGNDIVDKYVLLSNSHDGSMAVTAGFTPIQVVCNNTLSMATEASGAKLLKVRHTEAAKVTLEKVREVMNLVNQSFEATAEQHRFLASKTVSKEQVEKLVKVIMKQDEKEMSTRSLNQLNRIVWLWENGKGNDLPGVRGTAWAAYNAVTEYISHEASSDEDKRQASLWFGANAVRNQFALAETMKLAA